MADYEGGTIEGDLIVHFCNIAGVNENLARDFLTQSKWDLQVALNNLFEDGSENIQDTSNQNDQGVGTSVGDPIMIPDDPARDTPQVLVQTEVAEAAKCRHPTEEPSAGMKFTLLSWNVDGLDQRNLMERTRAVCQSIETNQPDVVFLQEVVQRSLPQFQKFCPGYTCVVEWAIPEYFNIILLKNTTVKRTEKSLCVRFPGTAMGRYLLVQPILFRAQSKFVLMTSHLESTAKSAGERKKQLKQAFEFIQSQDPSHTILFGGDMNLRDQEVRAVGMPMDVRDAWEACGSCQESKFTWDVSENGNLDWQYDDKPKCRFDRLFVRQGKGDNHYAPSKFSLFGKQPLTCGRCPSDHWGIICDLM